MVGSATVFKEPEADGSMGLRLQAVEQTTVKELRRRSEEDRAAQIAHAVTRLLAAIVA